VIILRFLFESVNPCLNRPIAAEKCANTSGKKRCAAGGISPFSWYFRDYLIPRGYVEITDRGSVGRVKQDSKRRGKNRSKSEDR